MANADTKAGARARVCRAPAAGGLDRVVAVRLLRGWASLVAPADQRANPALAPKLIPSGSCHAVLDDGRLVALCGKAIRMVLGDWPPAADVSSDFCRRCAQQAAARS